MTDNHYEILGVREDAEEKEIKEAFRRKAKEFHPDTSRSGKNPEDFLKVETAYEVLSDACKRRQYDRERGRQMHSRRAAGGAFRDPFAERPPERPHLGGHGFDEIAASWFEEHPTQYYHVTLSPVEAALGVSCPLSYSVRRPCPRCGGRTFFDVLFCSLCRGAGAFEGEREITLEIPAGVRHGTTYRIRSGEAVLVVEISVSPS